MIAIATGGRYFEDTEYAYRVLDEIHSVFPIEIGIHGGCEIFDSEIKQWCKHGLDWIFNDWCFERKIDCWIESGAPWFQKYGKRGGHLRNEEMCRIGIEAMKANEIKRIRCIAFEGGNGTKNMIENAERHNIKVIKTWEKWK